MGFFGHDEKSKKKKKVKDQTASVEILHRMECNACPLNQETQLHHPHMKPTGAKDPDIYIIGEGPGETEDIQGKQFVGKAGRALRIRLPKEWLPRIRWNNVVRTRPPKNREPTFTEIECCRPSIIRDIEQAKPKAIFGFGAVPLHWAVKPVKHGNITNWCGRRVPVQIGKHTCWFFPMLHPSYVMRSRKWEPRHLTDYGGSDLEFGFAMDLWRALAAVDEGLPEPVIHSEQQARSGVEIVTGHQEGDLERVRRFLRHAIRFKKAGLDFETFPLRPYDKDAQLLSFAVAVPDRAMAIALGHKDSGWSEDDFEQLDQMLAEFLSDPDGPMKVVHNVAFEMEWIAVTFPAIRYALWKTKWADTQAQAYILDERQGSLSLEFLVMQYFGINLKELSGVNTKDLRKELLETVLTYNAMDAKYHLALHAPQKQRLLDEGLYDVYKHHMRRIPACVLTQVEGTPVNQKVNKKFKDDLESKLIVVEKKIAALPDIIAFKKRHLQAFRPSATKDLALLLHHHGFHPDSVDEKNLVGIKHPIAQLILDWREIAKQLSTYVLPLTEGHEKSAVWPDSKLHPILSTMKTRTWRSSSEDPNSQNFPNREHKEVRGQVKHKDRTMKIVAFDYAGIQARNIAMESKDPALVKAFWDRYNIHSDWRDQILRLYPRWIPKAEQSDKVRMDKYWRNIAKNGLVFPSFFGAQARKCSGELGVPIEIAEQVQEMLFDRFKGVKKWHQKLNAQYYELGYATGLSGFRRHAPISPNELINAPIQADESLIVFDAYSELSSMCEPRYQPIMEIHDDLTFLWPKGEIERNAEVVIGTMLKINYDWINVPLGVEMSVGDDWAAMKKPKEHGLTIGEEFFSDKWQGHDPQTGNWSDGTGWDAVDKRKK